MTQIVLYHLINLVNFSVYMYQGLWPKQSVPKLQRLSHFYAIDEFMITILNQIYLQWFILWYTKEKLNWFTANNSCGRGYVFNINMNYRTCLQFETVSIHRWKSVYNIVHHIENISWLKFQQTIKTVFAITGKNTPQIFNKQKF